jgi:glutamine synthetase
MNVAKWMDIVWTDLLGHAHIVRTRPDRLDEVLIDASDVTRGFGGNSIVKGPLRLVVDRTSEVEIPFEPGVNLIMADIYSLENEPSPYCSRSALQTVLREITKDGYSIQAAAELEFFLLDTSSGLPISSEIANYSITKGAEIEPIMRRVRNESRLMDIPIEASNPEYSGGQVEVNIHYSEALRAADRATLLRVLVRLFARQAGLDATFMAKPWTDRAGNGMHVHQSLWRASRNVFHNAGNLSELGRNYAAGILEHSKEFALFGCSTPNSYHRRADYSFAPTIVCWGQDNRTLSLRSIVGGENSTRLEQRDASADCNIYLTFAGQFAAGMDGIRRHLNPPEQVRGNAYSRTELPRLPETFLEAFDLLNRGVEAARLLPKETVAAYLTMLRAERNVVVTSASDWERDRYMGAV